MRTKVLIAVNTAWYLFNFRAGLMRALVHHGYEVVALASLDEHAPRLEGIGCRYIPFPIDYKGTHPGRDLHLLMRYYRLLRRERPCVLLGYTVKPNIFGSLAAHSLGIPVINNIGGLGTAFAQDTWLAKLVRFLYQLALSRSRKVFFQNEEDLAAFVEARLVKPPCVTRLPGSGVDMEAFALAPLDSAERRPFRFVLLARLLWDKGVGEYVEAARLVRARFPEVEFFIFGFVNPHDPTAIPQAQMDEWVVEGGVRYFGPANDVRPHIAAADCVVLPSYYREGVPRSLLEAASMGRPIITTDTVGCREVVEDGVNGFLCRPRDAHDLADKMYKVMSLAPEQRAQMGRSGRIKMAREFDERIVIHHYLAAIAEACNENERRCND